MARVFDHGHARLGSITPDQAEQLVRAGLAAPSMHNTQPWRIDLEGDHRLAISVDWERHVAIGDPDGRGLYLATGAALLNMRLAAHALGHELIVHLRPDPDTPQLLATVEIAGPATASLEDQALAQEISRRHTNRNPFRDVAVPQRIRDRISRASEMEGATLRKLTQHETDRTLALVRHADRRLRDNRRYFNELGYWTGSDEDRPDGVPASALGPLGKGRTIPLPDLGLAVAHVERDVAEFEKSPEIYVLATSNDDPTAWISAGRALERALLTASVHGVSASFLYQPMQLPEQRARLRAMTVSSAYPQMVLRFGYGPAVAGTRRRIVSDVLRLKPG
jgi:hypothetical protein